MKLQAPEGKRYGTLFTYAEGEPPGKEAEIVYSFGNLLARIHEASDGFPENNARKRLDLEFLLERPLENLDRLGQRQQDWDYLRKTAELIRRKIEAIPAEKPYFGFCHGDAGSGNVHVSPAGEMVMFDFDFCGPGWRGYDVATYLSGESTETADAFLAGYEGVRELIESEKTAVPYFQAAQSIWMLGTRASYINEWGDTHFSDAFVDRVLNQIRTAGLDN